MSNALPGGTVTFVFTDIEGSTALLKRLGERYTDVVATHRSIVREELGSRGGVEIDTQGDAFFFSFARATDAVAAAVAAQRRMAAHSWPDGVQLRMRMSLHTGEPVAGEEGYVGIDVVRAARICSAGHGGQVLLSAATAALVGSALPDGVRRHDLGEHRLKDIDQPEHIYQLDVDGLPSAFPPLRTTGGEPLDLDQRLEQRIESYVERQLESAFLDPGARREEPAAKLVKLAAGGLFIAFLGLALSGRSDRPGRAAGAIRVLSLGTRPSGGMRCALDEVGEGGVELRVQLCVVAVAREHQPLGREVALEDVADRVERCVVGARDDELREGRLRELAERDTRLPRPTLHHERARALLELGWER